ncbi:MAG: alpha/beta fold hydrolase [Oceanicaulis sp.]
MKAREVIAPAAAGSLWSESIGKGEAVLLVAGANAPGSMWPDELVQSLAQSGRRVIRYDHRDTGRSSRTDPEAGGYAVTDLAADAVSVLDAHGVDAAHVVGLSLGGTIGQVLALDHPGRLKSLTVMMAAALDVDFAGAYVAAMEGRPAPGDLPGPDPEVVRRLAGMFAPGEDEEAEVRRRVEQWRVLNGAKAPFTPEEFAERERRAIRHAGTITPPTAHAGLVPAAAERGRELAAVTLPALVVQGAQDPLNPPPHGAHIVELMANARLVEIEELGHALPGELLAVITDHLTDHFDHAERTS